MWRAVTCTGLAAVLTATAVMAQGQSDRAAERADVEKSIRDSIGWALTKDRPLLESVIAHDPELFMFNPDSKSTIGWDSFVKGFDFWMDPRFKATSLDVRDLRITFSRTGNVSWFSAILDDLGEWDGKPIGWKDTRWTGVLERRAGKWVIVQMHFSFASDRVLAEAQKPANSAVAQAPKPLAPDLAQLTDGKNGQVFNRALTVATEGGRAVARLDARAGDGGVLLEGVQMSEGVIEVDLRGKDVAQQSFVGIAFHVVDWTTFDAVYFRPFNFRGADPERRSHSLQYVSHPVNTWQKLRADKPGQFESAIEPQPDPNDWFHARVVLTGGKVKVYVNGAATPSLAVDDLGTNKSGGVALFVGNGSDGAFRTLTITPTAPAGPPPASTQNIFQASGTGNLTRVRTLVEADAQLAQARNPSGLTPLHMTALYGQRGVAEYVIGKGADVNAVARHAGTPLDLAYESGQDAFVSWLESRGARFTPVRFDVTPLTPAIHRVAFPWGMMNNVVVFAGTDGAVVVDSGFTARAVDELKKVIAGFTKSGTQCLISSHGHGDHVAGNALAPSPGAIISAASLAANTAGPGITRETQPLHGRSGRTLPAPYTLRSGGAEIKLIPRPGLHSDADVIVYFPSESVVAMGDLLLSESMPAVTDIPGYLAFLDEVLDVFPENATFISGHGRDLNAAGVRAYRDALTAMVGIIRANLAAGRTVDQMVQDDILKAYKPQYSLLQFLTPDSLVPRVK